MWQRTQQWNTEEKNLLEIKRNLTNLHLFVAFIMLFIKLIYQVYEMQAKT